MRIVVAMPPGPAGERFESILRARGHTVMRFEEQITPREALDSGGDVFLCGDRKTIRTVVASGMDPRPYIIAALSRLDDKSVAGALAAGATDFMTSAACAEEIVARIGLPDRLAVERGTENAGRMRGTDTWASAPKVLSDRVGYVLEKPVATGPHEGKSPQVVARICVTCREDGSTIDVLVGCSGSSGKTLVGMLAPGAKPTVDALRDGLREMTNHLAGALKQSLTGEGVPVTLGLPTDAEPDAFLESPQTWAVKVDDAELVLGLISGRGGPRMVAVCDLEPGMVLRHDVLNAAGMPFIRSGTALTERTIERLSEVLGPSFAILVAHGGHGYEDETALDEDGLVLFEAC